MTRVTTFVLLGLLLAACAVIALFAVFHHRKEVPDLGKLESILSFVTVELDECVIGKMVFPDVGRGRLQTVKLTGAGASAFANQFAAIVRQNCVSISPGMSSVVYTYDIVFKGHDLTCKFIFGFPNGAVVVDYTKSAPTSQGTLILRKDTQKSLEPLLEGVFANNSK